MKSPKVILMLLWRVAFAWMMVGCAATATYSGEPKDIPILQKWSGDYPIVHLNRLPQDQQKSRIGYIGNTAIFATVWQAFKPGEKTPEVDFSRNFVVFSRNVDFYNRISIFKITLKDGVIEILAMETRSALPIEDKVAMAIAVIPREGVKFIQAGKERIPIAPSAPSADLLNSIFTIERQEVRLIDGYHKKQAAPGSATKIKTMVFGQPVTLTGTVMKMRGCLFCTPPAAAEPSIMLPRRSTGTATTEGQMVFFLETELLPRPFR